MPALHERLSRVGAYSSPPSDRPILLDGSRPRSESNAMPSPPPPSARESDVARRRRIAVEIVADALIQMAVRTRLDLLAREATASAADRGDAPVPRDSDP